LIDNTLPSPNDACPAGWSAHPPVSDRQGAYTCVSSDGRQASIVLRGRVLEASGKLRSIYDARGQFVARNQAP
jgi:hypothetical protein